MHNRTQLVMSGVVVVVVLLLVSVIGGYTAGYWPTTIQEDQALVETKHGEITTIFVGGGRHSSMTYGMDATVVGLGARSLEISTRGPADCLNAGNQTECAKNGRAWTVDPQPIIVTVVVDYRIGWSEDYARNATALKELSKKELVANAINFLWAERKSWVENPAALEDAIEFRVVEQIKEVTVKHSLLDLVGIAQIDEEGNRVASEVGREEFADSVKAELQKEFNRLGLEVLSVAIKNIDPADDEYEAILNDASSAEAQAKAIDRQLDTVRKQQEKAALENDIMIDKAEADAQVRKINAEVYDDPATYQLELARIWAAGLGEGTVYFLPADMIANLFMGKAEGTTPVVVPAQ